jgi:hypothetical protein
MPTLVASYQVDSASNDTSTLTTPSFTPAVGEIIVVKGLVEDSGRTLGTPSGGGGSYTQQVVDTTASHVYATIWTSTTTVASSTTVSLPFGTGAAAYHSMVVERWSNAQLAATPATADTRGTGAPSTTLTTAASGSVVSWCCGDWAAIDGTSRTYNTTSASPTEDGYRFVSTNFTAYWAYQTAASASSQTFGLTAPTGQTWTLLGIEIQDLPAASQPAAGYWPVLPPPLLFELVARNQAMWLGTSPAGTLFTQNLAGSVTPTGALQKAVTKPGLTGSVTSTGALANQTNKALAGSVTPTGVLTAVKVVLRSFAGSVTPTGSLAKQVNKALSGSVTPAGALAKQVAKALAGSVTSSGALAKLVAKALAGAVTPTGVLTTIKVVLRSFAGAVTPTGVLTRQTNKALSGSSTPRATLARAITKTLAGSVAAVGSLAKLVAKPLSGRSTPTGGLTATPVGATQNATSTAAVAAQRSSTSAVNRSATTSTAAATPAGTSTSGVTASRTSTSGATGRTTSTPDVSDG